MNRRDGSIKLGRTSFLVLSSTMALLCLTVAAAILWPGIYNIACAQWDLPEYERQFGFRVGQITIAGRSRGRFGIVSLQPEGAFSRAGLKVGDIPKTHHGIAEVCGDLAQISERGIGTVLILDGAAFDRGEYLVREVRVTTAK